MTMNWDDPMVVAVLSKAPEPATDILRLMASNDGSEYIQCADEVFSAIRYCMDKYVRRLVSPGTQSLAAVFDCVIQYNEELRKGPGYEPPVKAAVHEEREQNAEFISNNQPRRTRDRDWLFAVIQKAILETGATPRNKHAKTRDFWNALDAYEREAICPTSPDKIDPDDSGRTIIKKAVRKCGKEREQLGGPREQ